MISPSNIKIAVVGLGYVGLPLAVAFSNKYVVQGFDIDENRIFQLSENIDATKEIGQEELLRAVSNKKLFLTHDLSTIKDSNVFIVTVPTPIDRFKKPNLAPLIKASEMLGSIIKDGDVVIYESTVYPGCTEEDCVPVLEKHSGLVYNQDFFVGYSPERINPGDKINTL
ncbi:MAG: Vi polysaccharide biosynthesis UDP-N-acetylglucosamine C-6 dehydrogenase TviB, partial [Pedobacter sp.]